MKIQYLYRIVRHILSVSSQYSNLFQNVYFSYYFVCIWLHNYFLFGESQNCTNYMVHLEWIIAGRKLVFFIVYPTIIYTAVLNYSTHYTMIMKRKKDKHIFLWKTFSMLKTDQYLFTLYTAIKPSLKLFRVSIDFWLRKTKCSWLFCKTVNRHLLITSLTSDWM